MPPAKPRVRFLLSPLAAWIVALPAVAQDGGTLFTTNCAACHLPDRMQVGPSLVEISKLYRDKLPEFVAWCHEPKQKRPGVIQMPSMAHVGEANLKLIHAHIVKAAEGLQEVKVKGADPYYASPSMRRRPQVQRIFMPECGPAAIAVAVNDELHYCWDAGSCRLRYIWKGDFIDGWNYWRGNGNGLAKIQGEVLWRSSGSPPLIRGESPSPQAQEAKFLGYSLKDGLPTFRWRSGGQEVHETIRPTADGAALVYNFELQGPGSEVELQFPRSEKVRFSSGTGRAEGDRYVVRTDQDGRASLTLTPR